VTYFNNSQGIATASQADTTNTDVCLVQQFMWGLNFEGTYCCPGRLKLPQGESSEAYYFVGAEAQDDGCGHTTPHPSCSTTVGFIRRTATPVTSERPQRNTELHIPQVWLLEVPLYIRRLRSARLLQLEALGRGLRWVRLLLVF
jgi:hypothetical protein